MVRIRIAAVTTLALVLGLILPAPASAQAGSTASTPSASTGGDDHGDYEIGINFFDRVRNRGVTTTYKPGWYAGASYRITHAISVLGELGGDYKKQSGTTLYVYTFSGGVRFESGTKAQRVKPFAQILMGTGVDNGSVGQSPTKNHFPVVTPGGGVDLGIAKHFAARLKLDFPLYATFGDVHKGLRLSLGASIPVGTK
jgi:hypothetical protein